MGLFTDTRLYNFELLKMPLQYGLYKREWVH